MNKKELADKIRNAPGFSNDEKAALLELVNRTKKYGLVWENKPEDVNEQLRTHIPVLKEVKEKAVIYDPADEPSQAQLKDNELFTPDDDSGPSKDKPQKIPNHIIIESDNLHALVALQYSHAGKIDFIYIDPPYNTGNKDFKYNDTYVDKEDSFRHSKWLNFMHKRLVLARKLMREDGVIFISIDDNEVNQLKILCDEIFGLQNFIATMIWQQGKKHIGTFIGVNHEYFLVYARDKNFINDNSNKWRVRKQGLEKIYAQFEKLKKKYGDDFNGISAGLKDFYRSLSDSDPAKAHAHYDFVDERGIYFADNISQGTGNGPRYDVIHPITKKPCVIPAGGWRYSEDTMAKLLSENRIHFGDDHNKVPCRKRYLKETEYELPTSVFYRDGRGATKQLEEILGKSAFNNPKDVDEIAKIISFRQNSIILDFFAGSGPAMHATMKLNAEDGGNRQCILVTNNENNICEEVTYERNKRVIQGYTTPKGNRVEGLKKNNLRYFKTELLDREENLKNFKELTRQSTDLLRIKEDCYNEVHLEAITPGITRLFENDNIYMMIIFDDRYIDECIPVLKDLEKKTEVYVFAYGQYPYTDDFEEVLDKIELCAIPDAIYEAYQPALPPKKAPLKAQNEEEPDAEIIGEEE